MGVFGYSKRAREVEIARMEVNSAFADLTDRWDDSDPKTKRWKQAIGRFRAALDRVYAGSLREFAQGTSDATEVQTADLLDFLEADPMFFRSGYMKERVLRLLKQRDLEDKEIARFQGAILKVVGNPDRRREFRYYCRAAVSVDGASFRNELQDLENSDDSRIALRANWALAALDGKFEEISIASRKMRWWHSQGLDLFEKASVPRRN